MRVDPVEFVKSASALSGIPPEGLPEIGFLGPSNVGKSTLVNALLGRRSLAKVSRTPGRTQLLNYFRVNRRMFFVDLPGYGFAKAPRSVQLAFRKLVEDYLAHSKNLVLLFLLLDCRRPPSAKDLELKGWLDANHVPHVIVLTKADKLSRAQLLRQVSLVQATFASSPGELRLELSSAKTGAGKKELWRAIEEAVAGRVVAG